MKKIYIVTGANGFLGNNIIRKLEQDDNNEIRAFVLNGESIKSLEKLKCKIYYGDVTKKETLLPLFENIEGKEVFVIHCAAVVYIKTKYNPLVYNVNVNGTKNVVDKVLETKAKLIYISSVHAIPEKENNDLIEEIIKAKGWIQISDEGAIKEVVMQVLEANPQSIADFKAGKDRALGFLVGQAMKQTKGKANPQLLNKMFLEELKK